MGDENIEERALVLFVMTPTNQIDSGTVQVHKFTLEGVDDERRRARDSRQKRSMSQSIRLAIRIPRDLGLREHGRFDSRYSFIEDVEIARLQRV